MRRFGKSLTALTLITGATIGGIAAAGTPALADSQNGLVNVHTQDIASGNQVIILQNVPISVAANVCGIDVAVLTVELPATDQVACTAKSDSQTKSWVSFH
ncbi:MAG: hypothetical protein QOE03_759 [Micromonosporaceae bacterium]|jgi:hypothetical protein|nr:hypothetical protein [Micromonosporaceae bacterium]